MAVLNRTRPARSADRADVGSLAPRAQKRMNLLVAIHSLWTPTTLRTAQEIFRRPFQRAVETRGLVRLLRAPGSKWSYEAVQAAPWSAWNCRCCFASWFACWSEGGPYPKVHHDSSTAVRLSKKGCVKFVFWKVHSNDMCTFKIYSISTINTPGVCVSLPQLSILPVQKVQVSDEICFMWNASSPESNGGCRACQIQKKWKSNRYNLSPAATEDAICFGWQFGGQTYLPYQSHVSL